MFVSIVTITAVCVALAISGWNPPDESLYVEDSNQLLLSYDQAGFDWPYEISMDEIAEWFMFFDDRKLIEHKYSENHQCDCYGNAVYNIEHVITDRENLAVLHLTPFLSIRFPQVDLQRLTSLINGIQPETYLVRWKDVASQSKPGSLIRVNPSDRKPRQTISVDGRLLLLSIFLQIAVWIYKHHLIDKKIRKEIKSCQLTEERLEIFGGDISEALAISEAALMRRDRLDLTPKKIGRMNSYGKEDRCTFETGDIKSWTSKDGYSPNWYKSCTTQTGFTKNTSMLYEIPEWRYPPKEHSFEISNCSSHLVILCDV